MPAPPGRRPPNDPKQLVGTGLGALVGIQERPLGEHVAVFDGVHRALQDALATLDQG